MRLSRPLRLLAVSLSLLFLIAAGTANARNLARRVKPQCTKATPAVCADFAAKEMAAGHWARAWPLLQLACGNGHADSCHQLAFHAFSLSSREPSLRNPAEAMRLFRFACNQGIGAACFGLAAEKQATGDLQDLTALYETSCEKGITQACVPAAYANRAEGKLPQVLKYFQAGCQAGHKLSCDEVEAATGAPAARERLTKAYDELCAAKQAPACLQLGHLAEQAKNFAKASADFARGCTLNDTFACRKRDETEGLARKEDPYRAVRIHKLTNGLRVVLAASPEAKQAMLVARVYVGANHEPTKQDGIAHLTEHVLFRDGRPEGDTYLDLLKREAVDANGYTSPDLTTYIGLLPAERLPWLIQQFSGLLKPRTLQASAVEMAKKEIDIELARADIAAQHASGNGVDAYFESEFGIHSRDPGSPLAKRLTKILTLSQVQSFFEKFYHPKNMTLYVTGNFDETKTLELLQETFGTNPATHKLGSMEEVPNPAERPFLLQRISSTESRIQLGTKFWQIDAKDLIVIKLYFNHLALKLMKTIRSKEGKTYTVSPTIRFDSRRFGVATISFESTHDDFFSNLERVESLIQRDTRENGLGDAEIQEAKDVFLRKLQNVGNSPSSLFELAQEMDLFNQSLKEKASPIELIKNLSPQEIRDRLSRLFDPGKAHRILIRPPLFFAVDTLLLHGLAILLAFGLGRAAQRKRAGIEPTRPAFTADARSGFMAWLNILSGVYLRFMLVAVLASALDRLVDQYFHGDVIISTYAVAPLISFLAFTLFIGYLGYVPKRVIVDQGRLIIETRGYARHVHALADIELIAPGRYLGVCFRTSPLKLHASHFSSFTRGLRIRLKDGTTYFMRFSDLEAVQSGLEQLRREGSAPRTSPTSPASPEAGARAA